MPIGHRSIDRGDVGHTMAQIPLKFVDVVGPLTPTASKLAVDRVNG